MAAGGGGRQKTMGSPSSRKVAIVPRFRITTPEQVSFHYATAGMASRYLAWLIDESIIWAIDAALVFALAPAGETGIALIILGVFAIDFSYFTFFELRGSGQTPGKRVFGLRVISARGSQLRPIDLLIRNLLRPVDMLPFAMLTGATIAAIDKWGRRLGDLAADTIVIRDYRKALPVALANEKSRVNSFNADAALRNRVLTRVTREERDLIMDMVLRRDQLDPGVREELFSGAAAHFRSRLALPEDFGHLSDEQTVVNVALVLQEARFTI